MSVFLLLVTLLLPHSLHADEAQDMAFIGSAWLDKYEVTFEDYDRFASSRGLRLPDGQGWGRGKRPVVDVNWKEACDYCASLGKRLPTAGEWAAGARGPENLDQPSPLGDFAWFFSNSAHKAQLVGSKKPNGFGIFDMLGNVWEWTSNASGADAKEVRGGSWRDSASECRVGDRDRLTTGLRTDYVGFRCAKDR